MENKVNIMAAGALYLPYKIYWFIFSMRKGPNCLRHLVISRYTKNINIL